MSRNIIITGGCQGLGRAIAEQLKQNNNNNVIIVSNNLDSLSCSADEMKVNFYVADVTDYKTVEKAVTDIVKEYGKIDVLINNAGIILDGELDTYDYEKIKQVFDVNTLGTIYFSKAVVPFMKKQKSGTILNVSSVAGLTARSNRTVYNSSKWAVTGFTESLRDELAPYNIGVLGLFPGLINTSLFKNAGVEKTMENSLNPNDVAKVVEFMLSTGNMLLTQVVVKDINYLI